MSIHIIIDGYNLIRQSIHLSNLDLQDIQSGRDALVDMLAAYKKIKAHRITVVFDGTRAPVFSQQRNRRKGITIIFSHKGESADTVIKKMARKERQRVLVVSSDQDIVQSAAASGAAVGPHWRILVLHYLAIGGRPESREPTITFADLPTARSYNKVYEGRTVGHLCATVGREESGLRAAAAHYVENWKRYAHGLQLRAAAAI